MGRFLGKSGMGYGLLLLAGLALWLLMAGPGRVLGFDPGKLGMALLVGTAWVALYGVQYTALGEYEKAVSPGEWKARIGFGFLLIASLYFLGHLDALRSEADADARAVGRNLVMLLIAWAVLSSVIASRWKGQVQEDERDREIASRGSAWGRGALVFAVIALAVTLGLSPQERLAWATPRMMSHLLIFSLIWGGLFEHAAMAVQYWRDRR